MAFSFRAGTNWCHDFPKLARESGFCFNSHRTRVRVDWNRISSIDIDRVIRERDFLTVDDNVNNVVDYSLEAEYDVKILDPNFVKLFRLAQLSVEYLLYCKQYLDHSVVILKDELRGKLEENASLRKELTASEEMVKEMRDKMKERNRIVETKFYDANGELFKCPHCTKTFISQSFASAHVARRHPNQLDPYTSSSSPAHEKYRAETEKLHEEIKTLKERLNQTERVIRSESQRAFEKSDAGSYYEKGDRAGDKNREERFKEQQKKYQEEITSLKNVLFAEIKNLKQRDRSSSPIRQVEIDVNFKELVRKQELEIQSLKERLQEKAIPDLQEVHDKLQVQERHWKTVVDRLERQHRLDTENLLTQLKLNEEAAREMKEIYQSKVNELESHSVSQTKMITAQGKQLSQLSQDIQDSRDFRRPKTPPQPKRRELIPPDLGSISSRESRSPVTMRPTRPANTDKTTSTSPEKSHQDKSIDVDYSNPGKNSHRRRLSGSGDFYDESEASENESPARAITKRRQSLVEDSLVRNYDFGGRQKYDRSSPKRHSFREDIVATLRSGPDVAPRRINGAPRRRDTIDSKNTKKNDSPSPRDSGKQRVSEPTLREKIVDESEDSEDYSRSDSQSDDTASDTDSASPEDIVAENNANLRDSFGELMAENPDLLLELKAQLKDSFDNKLRDLGIDPEWNGIPNGTFRQKIETVAHHRNINSKKLNNYNRVQLKILKDVSHKLTERRRTPRIEKLSPLEKIMHKVKNKAASVLKHQKEHRSPVLKAQPAVLPDRPSRSLTNLEILPRKFSRSDIPEKKYRSAEARDTESGSHRKHGILTRKHSVEVVLNRKKPDEMFDVDQYSKASTFPVRAKRTVVTSTPKKSGDRSHSSAEEDSDHTTNSEKIRSLPSSPKNNKSVLKSTTGSVGSLVKKKVLFDLENGTRSEYVRDNEPMKKMYPDRNQQDGRKNYNDYKWNVSSFSPSMDEANLAKEKYSSTENLVLKTAQSDKIARISKKIQEQLNIARQKPVGGTEAMFSVNRVLNGAEKEANHYRSSTSIASSILESPKKQVIPVQNMEPIACPKPTPRLLKKQDSDELESDIEELLQIG